MKKLLGTILLIAAVMAACTGSQTGTVGSHTLLLDSLLAEQDVFEAAKLSRIAELKAKLAKASSSADRYLYNHLLFEEYDSYLADSALRYVDVSIDMSRRSGNAAWEAGATIDKAALLAASGLLSEAEELLRGIDPSNLDGDMLVKYYGTMIFLYSHLSDYTGGANNVYQRLERQYRDSVMTALTPAHPDYLWFRGWQVLGSNEDDAAIIAALEEHVAKSPLDSRRDAKDAYILSRLYKERADRANCIKYLTLSAIADVRCANAEIASMGDLAETVFDYGRGDIDRAQIYINYILNKAISYPNRVSAYRISKSLGNINAAHRQRVQEQQHRSHALMTLAIILLGILALAVVFIVIQNRRLTRQRRRADSANIDLTSNLKELSHTQEQLKLANDKLQTLNVELQSTNEELNEANHLKEEYIGAVFSICSDYISRMEEFNRNIHVKAITRSYKEIEKQTEHFDMRGELRGFYRAFDTVFLHIYPDFIADFNALLQPDKQVLPKPGELLNTELRIYALVRLGITDSVKIAQFLHLSPQTVYNNRQRVRNNAIIPRQDFAATVRTLGRTQC